MVRKLRAPRKHDRDRVNAANQHPYGRERVHINPEDTVTPHQRALLRRVYPSAEPARRATTRVDIQSGPAELADSGCEGFFDSAGGVPDRRLGVLGCSLVFFTKI